MEFCSRFLILNIILTTGRVHAGPQHVNSLEKSIMHFVRSALAVLSFAFLLIPSLAHADDTDMAKQTVAAVAEEALHQFTPSLTDRERDVKLRTLVTKYSDVTTVSQLILGRYWTKATPDQQTSFKSLLVDYAIGSWSKQLAALPPDERIDITGAVAGTDGHVIVHASSISAKETIPVDWLVAKADDGHWAVVDVTAEGVSVMQTMKGDFTAIIRAHGGNMDALLEALRQKIASFGK